MAKKFGRFYLDKEKDIIVDLYLQGGIMHYVLSTPNHHTGNLIRNLAKLSGLSLSDGDDGLKVIRGTVPEYIDAYNRELFIFRLADTKIANIYPDGTIEMKASVPSIAKTLMSQTKDYRGNAWTTILKTYILRDCKFRTDLHTHMNANLKPDILIALGIFHQIRYPRYYIKDLGLRLTKRQAEILDSRRAVSEEQFRDSGLRGKYLDRRIDDNTFLNFADLILRNRKNAAYNIAVIRNSLAVMKDGQAVFTNLEKVYLYRYVFTKGTLSARKIRPEGIEKIPDPDVRDTLKQMISDHETPEFARNSLFQDKLLWIARSYKNCGIQYAEISDTTLLKKGAAEQMLREVHEVMPKVTAETGVLLRFLAAFRRIPLTIMKDRVTPDDYLRENMDVLRKIAPDPYVAGSDIVGEEINDILELRPVFRRIVEIASSVPGFVVRVHAGENDSLRDNVSNSIRLIRESLLPGQKLPYIRIGHGLYTSNLKSEKGKALIREILQSHAVLEFQISSNVRLNNLSDLRKHPLKAYLKAGIMCVQGTDGGALYGTDSIDEELALTRLLGLTQEELLRMKQAEDRILGESLRDFSEKEKHFPELRDKVLSPVYESGDTDASDPKEEHRLFYQPGLKFDPEKEFSERIREIPEQYLPVIIAGGSFNNAHRQTVARKEDLRILDLLLRRADPSRVCFVIGHKLNGLEKHLLDENRGRFRIYAFLPKELSENEFHRIGRTDAGIRIAIEASGAGLYKSISYEIFKRRHSVLLAFDGNYACANLVQEAKNAKYKSLIYLSARTRMLREKAESLKGYAKLMPEDPEMLVNDVLSFDELSPRIPQWKNP